MCPPRHEQPLARRYSLSPVLLESPADMGCIPSHLRLCAGGVYMTEMNERDLGRPGEEAPELPPPPHSQPEPDVPDPDDETRDLVRPIKT